MTSVALFKGHRQAIAARTEDCVVCDKQAAATYFSPAVVRHPFVAVAETAADIRRSLLPLIFPPGQSATRPSSRRNVDRSAPARRQTGGRDANRSISRGPRFAAFRKKYRAFPLRSLT